MGARQNVQKEFRLIESFLLLDSRSEDIKKKRCAFATTLLFNCPIKVTQADFITLSTESIFVSPEPGEMMSIRVKNKTHELPLDRQSIEIMSNFISTKEVAAHELFRVSLDEDFEKKHFHLELLEYLRILTEVKTSFFKAVKEYYGSKFRVDRGDLFYAAKTEPYRSENIIPGSSAVKECTRKKLISMKKYPSFWELVKEKKELSKKELEWISTCPLCFQETKMSAGRRTDYTRLLNGIEGGCKACSSQGRVQEKKELMRKLYGVEKVRLAKEVLKVKKILLRDAKSEDVETVKKAFVAAMMMKVKDVRIMKEGIMKLRIVDIKLPHGKMTYPWFGSPGHYEISMEEVERVCLSFFERMVCAGDESFFRIGSASGVMDRDIFSGIQEYFIKLITKDTSLLLEAGLYAEKRFGYKLYEENLFGGEEEEGEEENELSRVVGEAGVIEWVSLGDVKEGKESLKNIRSAAKEKVKKTVFCVTCHSSVTVTGKTELQVIERAGGKEFRCPVCSRRGERQDRGPISPEEKGKKDTEVFYKKLSRANREVFLSSVWVYGQGRSERIIFKEKGKRAVPKEIHRANIERETYNPEIIFETEARLQTRRYILSESGKSKGLDLSMWEEILMLVMQERMRDKKLAPDKCIELVVAGAI